jgi:hypothetical protein
MEKISKGFDQKKLISCEMKMGESVVMFLGRIKALVNELIGLGSEMDEKDIMLHITLCQD